MGAALKKIAVSLLTDKKVLKVVGGIVLGIIIIIVMPIVAIVSIFNGTIEFDTAELQQMVEQNLSDEELAKLQGVEDTMYAIEDAMTAAGYDWQKVREAQVLYTAALYEFSFEPDFVSKLVGCFAPIRRMNSSSPPSMPPSERTSMRQSLPSSSWASIRRSSPWPSLSSATKAGSPTGAGTDSNPAWNGAPASSPGAPISAATLTVASAPSSPSAPMASIGSNREINGWREQKHLPPA